MIKIVEMIVMLTLLVFVFFLGVKYSDNVKNSASWLFEIKGQEVDIHMIDDSEIDDVEESQDEIMNSENLLMESETESAVIGSN